MRRTLPSVKSGAYYKRNFKLASPTGTTIDFQRTRESVRVFLDAIMAEHGWREDLTDEERHAVIESAAMDARTVALSGAIIAMDALDRILDARASHLSVRSIWALAGVVDRTNEIDWPKEEALTFRAPKWAKHQKKAQKEPSPDNAEHRSTLSP
jgi:hypothetical protein